MRESSRPFTRREAEVLKADASLGSIIGLVIIFVILGWGVDFVLGLFEDRLIPGLTFSPARWFAVLSAGTLFVWSLRSNLEFRRELAADLAGGSVRVRAFQARSAVEFEDPEDLGPAFVVTCEDEHLVFWGQDLDRLVARGFPWTDFEIVEAPNTGRCFRIRKLGPPLSEVERVQSITGADQKKISRGQRNYAIWQLQESQDLEKVLREYREASHPPIGN